MFNLFFTADWHLGDNRFKMMSRPFRTITDFHNQLIGKHNELVKPNDVVYMVGDVCYDADYLSLVDKFNGRKILFRGNHDRKFTDEQLSKYFEVIWPEGKGSRLNSFYITHYPTCGVKDAFNLVGHIHSAWKVQLNMLNVGVDVNHFYPSSIEDVEFQVKAIKEFYDEDVFSAYSEINSAWRGIRGKNSSYFNLR